jgi:hypothetical protein
VTHYRQISSENRNINQASKCSYGLRIFSGSGRSDDNRPAASSAFSRFLSGDRNAFPGKAR